MKTLSTLLGAVILGSLALAVTGVAFIVDETDQVVITRFGEPVRDPIKTPGLYFKAPNLIEDVNRFERRWLNWDGEPNEMPTKDKKYISLDTVARWRIVDPLTFLQSTRDMFSAEAKLSDIIDGATRDQVASHDLIEIVRYSNRAFEDTGVADEVDESSAFERTEAVVIAVGREKIVHKILEQANQKSAPFGIEVKDVRIKHINYEPSVREKVYDRMIAERKRIAEKFRSEGQGAKAKIEGQIEMEHKRISSEARRDAEKIRGAADAKAIDIYADAYNKDPEFYSFLKTLESYRKTLSGKTRLLQTTDTEYFKYLRRQSR